MIKLLIADDEPLICVGVQGLIAWDNLGIEIIGTARNGKDAYDIIEKQHPDIVIADIKMPIKNGLELAEDCRKNIGPLPLFIFLTSYEDFSFARKAVMVQAMDYLVKLDLSEDILKDSVLRCIETLNNIRKPVEFLSQQTSPQLCEKFFLRAFNNLFDNEHQFHAQKEELGIVLNAKCFVVSYCSISDTSKYLTNSASGYSTYDGVVRTLRETLGKQHDCYIISQDLRHFIIVSLLGETENKDNDSLAGLSSILKNAFKLLYNYFSIHIYAGVGKYVYNSFYLSKSYQSAKHALQYTSEKAPIISVDCITFSNEDIPEEFQFFKVHNEIRIAFEELNADALYNIITQIASFYRSSFQLQFQATEVVCNILYMAISFLPEGERTVSEIFDNEPDIYRCVYQLSSINEIADWLLRLRDGVCKRIQSYKNSHQENLIAEVKKYIRENLSSRLTLNEVAAVFNFTPNYLSKLFSKYANIGFVNYITYERIQEAKRLLAYDNKHIYEISEQLGFENAFYFSTVFKKIEGISPRSYLNRLHEIKDDSKTPSDTDN